MEILLSFCLRCLSRTASMTLRVSGSCSEPSLLRISAKNREKWLLSSLALYFKMSSLRPLVVAHIFQTLFQVLVVLIVLFFFFTVSLFGELLYFVPGNFREPSRHFFENKKQTNNKNARLCCCHGYLIIPSVFLLYLFYAEIPPLSTNQISEISWLIL